MSNEQAVKDVYAALKVGTWPTLLPAWRTLWIGATDGVASHECPWNGNFSGKANLPGFFQAVGENLDLPVFEIKAIAASGQVRGRPVADRGERQEERPGPGERRSPFLDFRRSREDCLLPALQRCRSGTRRLARLERPRDANALAETHVGVSPKAVRRATRWNTATEPVFRMHRVAAVLDQRRAICPS